MILTFRFGSELIKIRVKDGEFSMQSRQTGEAWVDLDTLVRASRQSKEIAEELRRHCRSMKPEELRL